MGSLCDGKAKKTAVCNDIAVVSVFCKRAVVGELTLGVFGWAQEYVKISSFLSV